MNIAAVSYYFRGKEGLYQAVLEDQFSPISQALMLLKPPQTFQPIERLTLYARQIATIHRQRPYLMRFMHSELIIQTPGFELVVKKQISQVFRFLQTAIPEGIAAGDFQADLNPDYAALSLAGILNFYFIAKPLFKEFAPCLPMPTMSIPPKPFAFTLMG